MIEKSKEEYFIELLNNLTIKTSDKYPDLIFYLYKDEIYLEYNQKTKHVWVNNRRIWSKFESKYSLNYGEIQGLTTGLVEEHLKLRGITTNAVFKYLL